MVAKPQIPAKRCFRATEFPPEELIPPNSTAAQSKNTSAPAENLPGRSYSAKAADATRSSRNCRYEQLTPRRACSAHAAQLTPR